MQRGIGLFVALFLGVFAFPPVNAWAFNALKQVGNYGEIYARSVGMQSPLKFGRGANALTKDCGLMYAPPM